MSINPMGFNNNVNNPYSGVKGEGAAPVSHDSVQIGGEGYFDLGPVANKKGLLRLLGIGRMKPEEGSEGVEKMGNAIAEGKITNEILIGNADNLKEQIKAACRAKDENNPSVSIMRPLFDAYKAWNKGEAEKPFSAEWITKLLTGKAGLKTVGQGSLSLNYEHHYDMNYGPTGGFLGTSCYNSEGKTHVMSARVLQAEGAGEKDPAVIVVDFERPAFVGLSLENTPYPQRSSSSSIFFVDGLGKIDGLKGLITDRDTVTHLAEGQRNMEVLLKSLDENAGLQFHDYGVGYGEVGTSYHTDVNIRGIKDDLPSEHKYLAGIVSLDHTLKEQFGMKS